MTILKELQAHSKKEKASFHMPGHKNGAGICGALDSSIFALDTTELCDTDALIEPTGSILAAEKQAAACYGARHSFYLVNGATGGILAMFYACFGPGDVVLIDRNCHRSVLSAAAICGITPVYITPSASALAGVPGTLSATQVAEGLAAHPEARGVLVTSPNYYGATADLRAIAQEAHRCGAVLLVDEAHGAHFPFSKAFPATAMEQGADLSVTSLHKTLSAPNQAALLHMAEGWDVGQVREAVNTFQTSSPSFILLAAMEQALLDAVENGTEKTERVLSQLGNMPYLDDPFKRLLLYRDKGYSGFEIDEILRTRFGIYAELCDLQLTLLMPSWANSAEDFALLRDAVSYLDSLPERTRSVSIPEVCLPAVSQTELVPLDVRQRRTERVPMAAAAGRISAGTVSAFPPCIPILLPGERIMPAHVENLRLLKEQGARLTGIIHDSLCVVV